MTTPFSLPDDLYLGEFEAPFPTPSQLVAFIFTRENDGMAYKVLRTHILEYAHSGHTKRTDWNAIAHDLRQYPELPHASLVTHGLYAVFRAGKTLLKGDEGTRS